MLRLVLSLAALVVFVLLVVGAWRGWQHRAQRQAVVTGAFPPAPGDPGAAQLGPTTGLYVGSTIAGDWQDRVTVGDIGFRATGALTLHADGVLLARDGASSIWIPRPALVGLRTDAKLAGKVTARGGLLVFRWRVGDVVVDTGFRGDGREHYPSWLAALPGPNTEGTNTEGPNTEGPNTKNPADETKEPDA
ncbi:MAG: transporter [Mycobacteriaceae bacterium]